MKDRFVKSSPRFFLLIARSMQLLIAATLALALICPAPLQEAANPAMTPNPVKSAWFLLWLQELVSWSRFMIWPVIGLGALFFILPWLPGQLRSHHAVWFPAGQRPVSWFSVLIFIAIILLTLTGLFFRGANWSLVY